jgi:hypothetical protein
MDSQQFRAAAHQMIDYVIDYLDNIRNRYPIIKRFHAMCECNIDDLYVAQHKNF